MPGGLHLPGCPGCGPTRKALASDFVNGCPYSLPPTKRVFGLFWKPIKERLPWCKISDLWQQLMQEIRLLVQEPVEASLCFLMGRILKRVRPVCCYTNTWQDDSRLIFATAAATARAGVSSGPPSVPSNCQYQPSLTTPHTSKPTALSADTSTSVVVTA